MGMDKFILGDAAYDALWTGTGFMLFSTVVFMAMTLLNTSAKRAPFYYTTTAVVTCAAASYLTMALGRTSIYIGTEGREFLWIRYADWAVTTPLLLLDLGMLAGATTWEIFFVAIMDLVMVAMGFAAAVSKGHHATWPLFVFGLVAFIPVLNFMLVVLPKRAAKAGPAVAATYGRLMWLSVILWCCYPIVWGTGEGGIDSTTPHMNPDQETICYAFLDIIAKCVFGFVLLMSHSAMDNSIGVTFDVPEFEEVVAAPAAAPAAATKSTKVVSETPAEVAV